jgi:hypothetical protein
MKTHNFLDGNGLVPAHRHTNGGGWVADTATVADSAYVGPEARVYGKAQVYGKARVYGDEILNYPLEGIPIVKDLDRKMLAAIAGNKLDMGIWHCGTTHCRAGWHITLAGDAGAALEKQMGSWLAGALIYVASTGRTKLPDFFASNEAAEKDIRACAAETAEAPQ